MNLFKAKVAVISIAIASIACGSLLFSGCGSDAPAENGIKYKEIRVERGAFRIVVAASGVVKPVDRVEVKSKASGQIEDLPVEEGDYVEQGALIARLDQKDERADAAQAQAELDIALAELNQAQRAFERRDQLYKDKHISISELDDIELRLAVTKSNLVKAKTVLDRANERLNESVVRAPVSGSILQKYVEQGQIIASGVSNVSGGTPIVDIADMGVVYVEAGIDEIDIGKVNVGQTAVVAADAYPMLKFTGKIARIAPEAKIEQNVTLFDVIVEVANKEGKLKSGMNTNIEISIVNKEGALLVPSMALQASRGSGEAGDNQKSVLLKTSGGFKPHSVETGLSNFKQTEILSGLSEGDILGVSMKSRLKDANDRLERRIKSSRSFGGGKKKGK